MTPLDETDETDDAIARARAEHRQDLVANDQWDQLDELDRREVEDRRFVEARWRERASADGQASLVLGPAARRALLAEATEDRNSIQVTEDLKGLLDRAEESLCHHVDGRLTGSDVYVRARQLVHVVRDRGDSDWISRPDGTPVITRISDERLRELLGVAAQYLSLNPSRPYDPAKPVMPPTCVVQGILNRGDWEFLPPLEGVVDAPTMRPDGSILDVPGYDPATRLIYDPCGVYFPHLITKPTKEDAARAMAELLELFVDFPFVDVCDESATAALILSMIGRGAISGCVPMFVSGAPTPGSGKGKLVDICSIIATGRAAPKMSQTTSEDEDRKRLLALAMEAPPLVLIDNVEGAIGSGPLAMALTAGVVTDRILGSTSMVTATLRPVWAVTGNNVSLKGDLGRRCIPIDLDPKTENPEDRNDFRHRDLEGYVRDHRPRLVIAALTVLRAYDQAGRPAHGAARKGSFEAWDDLVRGAIIWAGYPDPLEGVSRIRESGDRDRDNLSSLLAAWHEQYGTTPVTLAKVVSDVGGLAGVDPKRAALRTALEAYDDKLRSKEVANALRKLKGRISGGLRLCAGEKTKKGILWSVVG